MKWACGGILCSMNTLESAKPVFLSAQRLPEHHKALCRTGLGIGSED
ncbi:MAG: hypothetical protein QW529_02075 [Sulfolobales archaeon]